MKKFISLILFFSFTVLSQTAENEDVNDKNIEEVVVKGNVLYSDQVTALKTPVPVLDVPQTVSIVTDDLSLIHI